VASSGFSVTVSVVDQASPTLAKASKSVDQYRQHWLGAEKALKDLDKTGREALKGIVNPRTTGAVADFAFALTGAGVRAGRAFQGIGQSVRDAADQLARFSPAIGTLGAAGTVAGFAALARGFGQFGIQTTKTAAALDLSVRTCSRTAALGRRQGCRPRNSCNRMRRSTRRSSRARAYGGPALSATNYAKALGLGLVDISKDPETVRKQVADVVKRMHLLGINVETQAQFLEAFGISREEISLMQQGGYAQQELHDRMAATVVISDELVERGKKLGESLIGLGQSAETAGWKLAGDLEPRLRPLIDGFASLLTDIGKIPGGMAIAETAIGGLFALFTVEVAARMKSVSLALWGLRAGVVALAGLSVPAWLLGLLGVGLGAAFIEGLREGAKPGDLGVTGQPGKVIDPEIGRILDMPAPPAAPQPPPASAAAGSNRASPNGCGTA
jgi:hypothetical protein